MNFSIGIGGGGVDCNWVARRDRKGDDVFFNGGSSDGNSSGSRLHFSGVELITGVGIGGGLSFGDPLAGKGVGMWVARLWGPLRSLSVRE